MRATDPFTGQALSITSFDDGIEMVTARADREPLVWPNGTPWGADAPWLKDYPKIVGYPGCTHPGAKYWDGKQWVPCN